MALTIGQFLAQQAANPDTADSPYTPAKSLLEIDLPEVTFNPSLPSALPPAPGVALLPPAQLPPPPNVTLGTPSALPPPPAVQLSVPATLPPEVAPPASIPAALPPPPAVQLSQPAQDPVPPPVTTLPPAVLPPPPDFRPTVDVAPPPPPDFGPMPNAKLPDPPVVNPDTGYSVLGGQYSQVGGGSPGDLATDPFLYERQLERTARLPPGKLAVHALTQVGLWAQNVFGTVWNPAMVDPPPIGQAFVLPALDLSFDGTEALQVQIGDLVDEALDSKLQRLESATQSTRGGGVLATFPSSNSLKRIFENTKKSVANAVADPLAARPSNDPLLRTAFAAGIIPMKLKGESRFGFHTFQGGNGGTDKTNDDDVYVPLSFADLRPVGNTYRIVYFRPIITGFSENLSPEWNKSQYLGRVDPVATYMATNRTISLSFKLVAFGPEDVRTIYQKLHWLSSMVYPEYDSNLSYKSGPVVRMRVGDVVNAVGPEGARGLPGVIDSLDFDYGDKIWELKKGFKVPREIDVSLTFTVLHDVPIGRGSEGLFGGLGLVDSDGTFKTVSDFKNIDGSQSQLDPDYSNFRNVGASEDYNYGTLKSVKEEASPPADPVPPDIGS